MANEFLKKTKSFSFLDDKVVIHKKGELMSEQVVNLEQALERLGDDKEFILELLTELTEQVDKTIPQFEEAIKSSNYDQINSLAHGLKGASANLNADQMAELFKELEILGKNKNLAQASDLITKSIEANKSLKEYLETI